MFCTLKTQPDDFCLFISLREDAMSSLAYVLNSTDQMYISAFSFSFVKLLLSVANERNSSCSFVPGIKR